MRISSAVETWIGICDREVDFVALVSAERKVATSHIAGSPYLVLSLHAPRLKKQGARRPRFSTTSAPGTPVRSDRGDA